MKRKCPHCNNLIYGSSKYCDICKKEIYKKPSVDSFVVKNLWCPWCNYQLDLSAKFCDCGWEIKKDSALTFKISGHIWEKHLPFINEYRHMKDMGTVKSGYEYFKLKVGNTELGKIIVKKVEHGYSKEHLDSVREINSINNSFPEEWK